MCRRFLKDPTTTYFVYQRHHRLMFLEEVGSSTTDGHVDVLLLSLEDCPTIAFYSYQYVVQFTTKPSVYKAVYFSIFFYTF